MYVGGEGAVGPVQGRIALLERFRVCFGQVLLCPHLALQQNTGPSDAARLHLSPQPCLWLCHDAG